MKPHRPCIYFRYVKRPNGRTKRITVIRVRKGVPICETCWAIYKITLGRRWVCRWCKSEEKEIPSSAKKKNRRLGCKVTPNTKAAFQRSQGFAYKPRVAAG